MNSKQKVLVFLHLFLGISQITAAVFSVLQRGWWAFQFYTLDSNIFSAITSILLIWSLLTKNCISQKIHNLRFYSTCCVAVTFIVVVAILIPMFGIDSFYEALFYETNFWHHTCCPLLNIFSFIFLEKEKKIQNKQILWAVVPTFIYAVVAIVLNLLHIMDGPYPFLQIYKQGFLLSGIWLLVIMTLVYFIAFCLKKLNDITNS